MRKFGEIGRVKSGKIEYIIITTKHEYGQLDIPWFDIFISKKSTKRLGLNSQYDLLGNVFNFSIMKKIEEVIKNYIDQTNPEFLAVGAHMDCYNRRMNLYSRRLKAMGYIKKEEFNYWGQFFYIYEKEKNNG